jgi:uncharacterized protein (DUF1800 family)
MHTTNKSLALHPLDARHSSQQPLREDRSQRLAALSLTFSMAAVLAACGGAASSNAPAEQGESTPDATVAARVANSSANGAATTRAQAQAVDSWVPCGAEGDICTVPGTRVVRYGANGTFIYKTVTGAIGCGNGNWDDPLFGVAKTCAYSSSTGLPALSPGPLPAPLPAPVPTPSPAPSAAWVACASEGGVCAVPGTRSVRYGANGTYAFKTVTGSIACNNSVWGDPLVGVFKACAYAGDAAPAPAPAPVPAPPPAPAPATDWISCATEGGNCSVPSTRQVRYGANTTYAYKTVTGSIGCNNDVWGDPLFGVLKSCAYANTDVPAPAPSPKPAPAPSPTPPPAPAPAGQMTQRDAVRLADQATFGGTEALLSQMRSQGAAAWVQSQIGSSASRYTSGNGDAVHTDVQAVFFCDRAPYASDNCWRDWFSTTPMVWDFYRNAIAQPDQLRQRVAFALQQIVVVSGLEISGTYGHRNYQNMLLDNAFGNYRNVLKKVALSPVMGDFLNNANNDKAAPNENFARELLQLFSIGTCKLNADGTLESGNCVPTYNNEMVRNYAYALTGWTYPVGGKTTWGCWPQGTNCQYYGGDMTPLPARHDTSARTLLSGVGTSANSSAAEALERVLDSLINHPNAAPFIGKQLIQFLVSSNPSPGYVQRVAAAFASGSFTSAGRTFGAGQRGDLAATVAAVLLDAEARGDSAPSANAGRLRDPAQHFSAVLRAFNGATDGDVLSYWWGDTMRQHMFRAPSVFNFYAPDYPVPGTSLVGPAFGIHNANTALERLNYLVYLFDWGGTAAAAGVPNAVGTRLNVDAFLGDAPDAAKLVDRLSNLALGAPLPAAQRTSVIRAVEAFNTSSDPSNWQTRRVSTAAFLIFGSPNYQIQR